MSDDLDFLYDEDAAVAHIRSFISQELKEKVSNDDILYIVDLVYEYYEESGLVDQEAESVEVDEDKVVEYITKNLKKDADAPKLIADEVAEIVRGEFDYSDSMGMFE